MVVWKYFCKICRGATVCLRLSGYVINLLINTFDQNRLKYMTILFPIYQVTALIIFTAATKTILLAQDQPYWLVVLAPLTYFFIIPIFATWHLSCLLFLKGYFDFFVGVGIPGMKFMVRFCDEFINLFR